MRYTAGVDVGSTQTKAVIIDENGKIAGRALIDTGADVTVAARNAFAEALADGNVSEDDVGYVVGTGYGRYKVTFGDTQVTEISCHGRGAVHMFPNTRTVLDMGGQDSKAISVQPDGEIGDFCMNDKCAAGTGRFLSAASKALDIPLDELKGVRWARLGKRIYLNAVSRVPHPEGKLCFQIGGEASWHSEEGTDFAALEARMIAVTPD